jgi:hypothetical protein
MGRADFITGMVIGTLDFNFFLQLKEKSINRMRPKLNLSIQNNKDYSVSFNLIVIVS